ncbi:MAG: hypothetical protein U0794_05495 [Isosphaeraceae bacterium]
MSHPAKAQNSSPSRASLGLYSPTSLDANIAHWRINGYRATIIIWTSEEWDRLTERPEDAQYYPCGVWCALRLET